MLALAAQRDAKIGNGVWSLNVEPLNFEPPQGFERSEAVERLERLELALSFCESAGPTPGRFPSSPLLFNPEEQRPKGIVNIPPMTD